MRGDSRRRTRPDADRPSLSVEVQAAIAARLADDRRQEANLAALIDSGELWRLAR